MTKKSEGLTMNQLAENNALLTTENMKLQQQVNALAAENDQLRKWLISDTMIPIDETAFASTDAIAYSDDSGQ